MSFSRWRRAGLSACALTIFHLATPRVAVAQTPLPAAQLVVFPLVSAATPYFFSMMGPTGHIAGALGYMNKEAHVMLFRDGTPMDVSPDLHGLTDAPSIFGINSSDQILFGIPITASTFDLHLLTNGGDFDLAAYNFDKAIALNNHGHVLGYRSVGLPSPIYSLAVDNGQQIELTNVTSARALNDSDQVLVGPPGIWTNGTITPVPLAAAVAFNNAGHVVGSGPFTDGASTNGEFWRDGETTDLPQGFRPQVVNNLDQIGGAMGGTGLAERAALWDNGTLIDLNTLIDPSLHFTLADVQQIDDFGHIFGRGFDPTLFDPPYQQYLLNFVTCADVDQNGSSDNDGDGLCDNWETEGIDFNHDGVIDLTLDNANLNHKDVYVEVDWMAQHQPLAGALAQVVKSYASSPVQNPDGVSGVTLHVQVDEQAVAHQDNFSVAIGGQSNTDFDRVKQGHFGTAAERASENSKAILAAKRLVYRYALFIHSQAAGTASGIAEIGGNDLVISLGNFAKVHGHNRGNLSQQAATFMHELGHSVGLHHGGDDDVNCKPNYLSVMSYTRQFDGDPILGRPLDYSQAELPTIFEAHLDETVGIRGPEGEFTVYVPPPPPGEAPFELVADTKGPVDFNDNGSATDQDVSVDITGPCAEKKSSLDVLFGFDDWSNLKYNFRESSDFADGVHAQFPSAELTFETALTFSSDTDADGVSNLVDNCAALANPDQADGDADGVGDVCDNCPAIFNPSQAPCATLPPEGEPDDPGTPVPPSGGGGNAGSGSSAGGDSAGGTANGGSANGGSMNAGGSSVGGTASETGGTAGASAGTTGTTAGTAGKTNDGGGTGGSTSSQSGAGNAGAAQSGAGTSGAGTAGSSANGATNDNGCSCSLGKRSESPLSLTAAAMFALALLRRRRAR